MMRSLLVLIFAAVIPFVGPAAQGAYASPVARMQSHQCAPAIVVDGKAIPPMTMTLNMDNTSFRECSDYLRRLSKCGIRVFYVPCATDFLQPGDSRTPSGVEAAVRDIRQVLSSAPEAYVMLRLNMSPPREWVNAHPEEQVKNNDGSHTKLICTSVSSEPVDGMYSLCSEAWRKRGAEAIVDFFGKLVMHPESQRVIGTFLCAGGTSEWYYPGSQVHKDGSYGDFSEPFRREFERYLRAKYGTEDELRRVWRRKDASFASPPIPTLAERSFINDADEKIKRSLERWETTGYDMDAKIDLDARTESNVGVFLNVNGYAHVADYFTAWHEATARSIVHFARTLKRVSPDRLVGAFYGSYGCQDYFNSGTATGTLTIMNSGVVDFLAAPGVYNNREPGGLVAMREMQDSFRLRNQIFISEEDSRTYRAEPWIQRGTMGLYTVRESVETLKRDFARNICEDIHGWWFDMGPYWYDDPDILDLFSRQREIADLAYSLDRTKKNEIALIYDVESVHLVSQKTSELVLDYYRTTDLARIGAPVDYYFHDDLSNPKMPDYKLYVMLNQYSLTDVERSVVYEKARRNGAMVLWMYAPGFVNRQAACIMDPANVSRTVGMKVRFSDSTSFPYFRVDPKSHPAVALASEDRRYGFLDHELHSNIWIGSVKPVSYMNPSFAIDDPSAIVLGRYCDGGKPALAMVETNGVKSVYCATQVVRCDLLRSLAAYAGCHLFLEGDDVLYANEHFVAVHASSTGRKRIRFKRPCSPVELYEKKTYGENIVEMDVDMRLGETKMWHLR